MKRFFLDVNLDARALVHAPLGGGAKYVSKGPEDCALFSWKHSGIVHFSRSANDNILIKFSRNKMALREVHIRILLWYENILCFFLSLIHISEPTRPY